MPQKPDQDFKTHAVNTCSDIMLRNIEIVNERKKYCKMDQTMSEIND